MATDPESYQKLRDEFKVYREEKAKDDPSLADLSPIEFITKVLTFENSQDLEWNHYVVSEAMRLQPPGQLTSTYTVKRDVTVGGLKLKAGQMLTIMIHAM